MRAIEAQLTTGESVLFALTVRSLAVDALHRSPHPGPNHPKTVRVGIVERGHVWETGGLMSLRRALELVWAEIGLGSRPDSIPPDPGFGTRECAAESWCAGPTGRRWVPMPGSSCRARNRRA